jgi:hypothetical protein
MLCRTRRQGRPDPARRTKNNMFRPLQGKTSAAKAALERGRRLQRSSAAPPEISLRQDENNPEGMPGTSPTRQLARGYNLAREILHRRGEKPNGCARNRLSRMIGVHE